MNIPEILKKLDLKKFDCDYCDVRIEETCRTIIRFRNFELLHGDVKPKNGCFIRIHNHGKWFYLSTTAMESLDAEIERLVALSDKFDSASGSDIFDRITPLDEHIHRYGECSVRTVPVAEKRKLCESYFETVRKYPLITESIVSYADRYVRKHFTSSKDVNCSHDYNMCELRIVYSLKRGNSIFRDSFQKVSHRFGDLANRHDRLVDAIEESTLFLDAPTVEPGKYTVVLDSRVVGVFAHESFGHKSEADFMLSDEKARAEWELGKTIGSDVLSIVDDGSIPDVSGYCPFDDEGTKSGKTYLIRNGKLAGRLHSITTAHEFGEELRGNARAINFEFEPIVRMTTTYIEPGDTTFDDLIAGVDRGIYIKDYTHGSGLSTFTIAPKKSYMIREGKIDTPVRVSVISGDVFQTLGEIEACSDTIDIENMVLGGCGKIEQHPLPIACGGPAIRVRNMNVS